MPTWQFLNKLQLKVLKRNILMQTHCQYLKLYYKILLSFQYCISIPTSLNLPEIISSLYFFDVFVGPEYQAFWVKQNLLILQTTAKREKTSEKMWSSFFPSSSSLTHMSDIKDRWRELFMAIIDFSSVSDGDVAVEGIKQFTLSGIRNTNFCQEIAVKKKKNDRF